MIKTILFTIAVLLYCVPARAMVTKPDLLREAGVWVAISFDDDFYLYYTAVDDQEGGGVSFWVLKKYFFVEQNIAFTAKPHAVFLQKVEAIGSRVIHLNLGNPEDSAAMLYKLAGSVGE